MKLSLKTGMTGKRIRVCILNASNVGLTGLVYNSSGLTWYYFRDGDTSATAVTPVTATLGTWTSGGFKEVDSAHMPGVYELGVPDAALAVGGSSQMVIRGAAGMLDCRIEFELDAVNYQSATAFIAAVGGTAIPTDYQQRNTDVQIPSAVTAAIAAIPTAAQNRQELDSNSTTLAAIAAKTTNLPTDPASETNATTNKNTIVAAVASSGLTAQQVADAVNNLAPGGSAAAGSIRDRLAGIATNVSGVAAAVWSYGQRWLTANPPIIVPSLQKRHRQIIQGDTYGSTGKAFTVNASDGGEWPTDLSGYTWSCTLAKPASNTNSGNTTIAGVVTVGVATGASRYLIVSLNATQTGGMALGRYEYDVQGASGSIVWTVEAGTADVVEDYST